MQIQVKNKGTNYSKNEYFFGHNNQVDANTNTNTDANTNMCTNTNIKRSTCLENHREQGTLFDKLEVQLVFCTY